MVSICPFLKIFESLPGYKQKTTAKNTSFFSKKKGKFWIELLIKHIKSNLEYPSKTVNRVNTMFF